ncbi:MAG TPA: hypothetical protein VFT55_16745, partial [Planctomycetota bacterium]|nr:hypothetical protein [Planctomycetota bacterium]
RAVHTGLRAGTWDVTADDHVGGVATTGGVELRPGEEPTPIELRLQPSGTLVVRCGADEDQEIRCRQGEHVVYADGAQPHEVRRIRLPGGAYEVELFVRGTLLRRAGADVTPGSEREVHW